MHAMTMYRSVLAAGLLSVAVAAGAEAQDAWSWNSSLRAGQTLEVKGVNGSITATAAPAGDARVSAVRRARRSNPADVVFQVVEHSGGVTICAVYPHRQGREPNECRPGAGGRMQVENNDVVVDFTVAVPDGVNFVGRTVNGGVQATGLAGDTEARTVNGAIRISTSGTARAHTVNGGIDATIGRGDWRGTLAFESTNGGVTVRLPADVNTELTVSTVNGGIQTDFPVQTTGRISPRRLTGTIGSGGRSLEVSTVNGGVSLRRQ